MYELRGELASGDGAKRLIRGVLCPILLPNENSAEVRAMKQWTWLALAGLLTTLSCGSDEAVQPTSDYADAWIGEYEGTGNFALSNGVSGEDRPVTISIVRVSPKQVTVSATLVYGEGRNDFIQAITSFNPTIPSRSPWRCATSMLRRFMPSPKKKTRSPAPLRRVRCGSEELGVKIRS